MLLQNDGISIWYGTTDAPAPEGSINSGTAITITVGMKPADASNRVTLLYRINDGSMHQTAARWFRNASDGTVQYFKAEFPVLSPGDTVQYAVIGKCGNRQVPASAQVDQLPSSFGVAGAGLPAAITRMPDAAPAGTLDPVLVDPPTSVTADPAEAERAIVLPYSIQGTLVFDHGLSAAGITVRLYDIGFGGQATKLGETTSDSTGHYALAYQTPGGRPPNLQVRTVDAQNNEVTLSATKFIAQRQETLNLVAPTSVQPLEPEFQRLAADMNRTIDGITRLGKAEESGLRRDLSLLTASTNWDARLLALAATAAQQAPAVGLGLDAMYALFRVGLPTDPQRLVLLPSETIQQALTKANTAGIVSLNEQQIATAAASFERFAATARRGLTAPGSLSNYGDIVAGPLKDQTQQDAFIKLYFSQQNPGADFWQQAAALKIPSETLDLLKLQGRFLYLTGNNAQLAQRLQQEVGDIDALPQLAAKDFHDSATWKDTLTSLAGNPQALQNLIPPAYNGKDGDAVEAYAADLARKVRFSFPTHVVARMVEKGELPVAEGHASPLATFLRTAAGQGYEMGKTPLNAFLKSTPDLQSLDGPTTQTLKTLHRLYQVTPSHESMQTALKLGFTSAHQIASLTRDDFMGLYAAEFPSPVEASLVYAKAQQISSVTFNFFSMARHLDTSPPLYGLSPSADGRQQARNAIVQQFPSMESLFGSLDFCDCQECRSVLSPAAYLVDLLEFLRQSVPNRAGYTPLDVLIGKDEIVSGRRPDLGALPLTCENTNTAMPYIDLVNEILEYYVAHNGLDTGVAYDTGMLSTADLTAEPQHILPQVYSDTLRQADYPLGLPFDLWIETVRGFLEYFKTPLSQVLSALRPADALELFGDVNSYPYYRAQIFAESLGLSPAEYGVLTCTNVTTQKPSVANWFLLYGYADENLALNGQLDPTDSSQYLIPPLKAAKNLAQRLGLSYEDLADLVSTGFLNPGLNALIFQFQRFHIDMDAAFSYTGQPGFPSLSAQDRSDFEAQLGTITAQYRQQNPSSTFDARTWLTSILPANYSHTVLVLNDPDTGCNFTTTTLQYADGSAATPQDFLKLNLFVRLWKKLGWTMDEVDRALQLFFPIGLPAWGDPAFAASFSAAWKTALVYLAHLNDIASRLNPALGRTGLLPLWSNLPAQGNNPLYAQLFLVPGVLNNDAAFDDPAGAFPGAPSDPLSVHQPALQGALGLSADDVTAILADAGAVVATVSAVINGQNVTVPAFSLANISLCYRYSLLATCLQVPVSDVIALKALSGLNPFQVPGSSALSMLHDDVLYTQTLAFLDQVAVVQDSGFSVEDLRYLLRHQYDPIGKYRPDTNALLALAQAVAGGLRQIQSQNAVPPDLTARSEALIDQQLSGLLPIQMVQALFTVLSDSQTYQATQGGVTSGNQLDPASFASESAITIAYDATTQTQTVGYQGILLDWKKTELLQINGSTLLAGLLTAIQQQAHASLQQRVGDILGIWASLSEYEAVQTGVTPGLDDAPLMEADPAISLSYDQADQIQWLAYRGVLTDANKATLQAVNASPILASLLNDIQQQALPAYRQLAGGMLAMWANVLTYQVTQGGVTAGNQIDAGPFAAYPAIRLTYDPASQTQTLTYLGVLTDAARIQLAALLPSSTVLATLLQNVRNQAVQFFQTQATDVLSVTAADLDAFVQPYLYLDGVKQRKGVKAALLTAFLPLQAQKLSTQFIVQTLTANLGSDPNLTASLLTDAGLLTDPNTPGKSLLQSYLALARGGVTASYYAATDGSGPPLAPGTAATVDTADPSNPNAGRPGTGSASFEGYLEVPTDGPYRFFAELGNQNAGVAFQLDSPGPTALLPNPVLAGTAGKDNDEMSQFVQLKGGVPYHFSVDFRNLGANGASMLVQGETLPRGPVSQIILYPQAALDNFGKTNVLLSKVLQIVQGMGLDVREVSYLTAHANRFGNLKLDALPTQASDDSPARAASLFSQFLILADYADLRKGPAGGSDGLVDVFAGVGHAFLEPNGSNGSNQDPNAPWKLLADLTRRDAVVVRDVARALGLLQEQPTGGNLQVSATGDFDNNRGIRRIWQALQLVQIVGIPVTSLASATTIVSPVPAAGTSETIATSLKNAVKARFDQASWRPVAKSVFDSLRRKKRDALVSYLVNELDLQNPEQLFEYFLVDPGMEPVVQTSRIRLALSSVQTFIQRCLLNLENGNTGQPKRNVSPAALDADWWAWMKRYRVWQANREIFLFPENWMEPELRLDKSDLFGDLESALLQGDVTRDLVEDAFLTYLKGLEQRARLDVVAMYLDQDPATPGNSTLHVLARTYGRPHTYFYRTYSRQTWSAWQKVTPDIDGNHIAVVVWRGRVNVFWVTFMPVTQQGSTPSTGNDGTALGDLHVGQLKQELGGFDPPHYVKIQLNWSEYFQGKWSNRLSSDLNSFTPFPVDDNFDADRDVYIFVSKEVDDGGNENAVDIHLDFFPYEEWCGFRVTSKNGDPAFNDNYSGWTPPMPYNTPDNDATLYTGANTLQAIFQTNITASGGSTTDTEPILDAVHSYALLTCGNAVAPPFLDPNEPLYQQAGGLVSPFFYKDLNDPDTPTELTFFVQPSLTETTIQEWWWWAIPPLRPDPVWLDPHWVDHIHLVAQVPAVNIGLVNPGDPVYSIYPLQDRTDWATNPETTISFGSSLIGQSGGLSAARAGAIRAGTVQEPSAVATAAPPASERG